MICQPPQESFCNSPAKDNQFPPAFGVASSANHSFVIVFRRRGKEGLLFNLSSRVEFTDRQIS
jgi:hypothetical protein